MAFTGVTLTDLNNFMKNYQTGIIVPDQFFWSSLYDSLKANIKKDEFRGDAVEQLIQTSYPFTGQAFGEDVDIPLAQDLGFTKQWIPLKQIITNAGITSQALARATGGSASWGRAVDAVLRAQRTDFLWLMEFCAIGDGTGRLARAVSASAGTAEVTVTCDNTYTDFGWENVALIKKGMYVQCYDADGDLATDASSVTSWKVTAVSFGNRANGAATTGTFTIACTAGQESTIAAFFDNGATVYWNKTATLSLSDVAGTGVGSPATIYQSANRNGTTKAGSDPGCALPIGLTGIVQNASTNTYSDGSIDYTLDTFQGLTRSSYPTLNSYIFDGDDLGGTEGTPADWDLSVISDAINQVENDTGGKITELRCSSELAMAINRRNRSEQNFSVQINSTGGLNQNAVGAQIATHFLCPDGRVIPIYVSKTIPRNCLYGINTDDLTMYTKGDFDFLKLNGEVWDKTYDDRKANFEAPFGGYVQIGAERCDRCFVIQDMKDNI